jgi:hypothetical protein
MITTVTEINVLIRISLVGFPSLTLLAITERADLEDSDQPLALIVFSRHSRACKVNVFTYACRSRSESVRTVYDSEQIKRRDIKMNCVIGSRFIKDQ